MVELSRNRSNLVVRQFEEAKGFKMPSQHSLTVGRLQWMVLFVAALGFPRESAAQVFTLPAWQTAVGLDSSPIGSWAEYKMVYGRLIATQRYILVAKKAGEAVLEVKMDSVEFVRPAIFRVTVAGRGAKRLKGPVALEVKIGDAEPIGLRMMEQNLLFPQFMESGARVGSDVMRVTGKDLHTTHFHHKIGTDYWDYWISEEVPPMGFVKSSKASGGISAVFELQAWGTGGRAEIHEPVRFVDGYELARRVSANLRKR